MITLSRHTAWSLRQRMAIQVTLLMSLVVAMIGSLVGCRSLNERPVFPSLSKAPIEIPIQWHTDFDKALQIAQSLDRPVLINFTGSDWCSWCVKIKEDIFNSDTFENWARERVILVELDFPQRKPQMPAVKRRNQEIAARFNVRGYPTVLLLSPTGEVLGPKLAYKDSPADWIASAEQILSQK